MDNYTGYREVFSCDFGPRNGAENVSDIVECFELFFDKELVQQIVTECRIQEPARQYFPISVICEIVETCHGK
jgi:hypothetical protein